MTEVLFYRLSTRSINERCLFVCKLTEKAYRLGRKILIRTESGQQSRYLDNQLWIFRQQSFIPHTLASNAQQAQAVPVLLSETGVFAGFEDVLINLHGHLPESIERFQRIVELVDDDERVRQQQRQKYRQYTAMGYRPEMR